MRSSASMMLGGNCVLPRIQRLEQPSACELGTAQQGVGGTGNHLLQDRPLPAVLRQRRSDAGCILSGEHPWGQDRVCGSGLYQGKFRQPAERFYSSGDTLLVLDSHQKPLYCSRPEYGEREISDIIGHTISGQGGTEKKRGIYQISVDQGTFPGLLHPAALFGTHQRPGRAHHGYGEPCAVRPGTGALPFHIRRVVPEHRPAGEPVGQGHGKGQEGDLSIRIRTNRQDELGRLTESFNQ